MLVLATLAIGGFGFHLVKRVNSIEQVLQYVPLGSPEVNRIQDFKISTAKLITTSSTLVSATNTARTYLRISNVSSNNIYCKLQTTPPQTAILYEGFAIHASSSAEFTGDNLYTGPVFCISTGNASTTVVEN